MSDINLSISSGTNVVTKVIESQNTISINPTASVTPTSLLGLTDVNASSITNGQILSYNASTGKFTPSSDSNSNTTYSVSCVDGDNGDEEKIRLTDSDGGTDDVVLEAGTGLSIARSSDKITLTNTVTDTNTQLSTEAVQDIVGGMFISNTETRVSATYQDADGTIDLVVDDMNDAGLENVVEDTTPQLGGNLDINAKKIVSTSNGDIDIEPNGTGDVLLGSFKFDADQSVGSGQNDHVLTYDHASGKISLEAASGGGGQIMTLTGGASVDTRTVEAFISMNYSTADFTANNAPMRTPLPLACTLGTIAVIVGGASTRAVIKVYQNASAIYTSAATDWSSAGDVVVFTVNSGSFSAGDTLSFSIDQSSSVDMNYVQATITLNVS